MNNVWKAYILAVEDGNYIVSGGASQGIAAGNVFQVVERGRSVKNPQTGLTIELPGKPVAKKTKERRDKAKSKKSVNNHKKK